MQSTSFMFESDILNIAFPFLWAFTVSVFAIPSIIYLAYKKRLFDEPNDRTIHERLTPRLGGLAIFAGFMSAITIFGKFTAGDGVQQMFAACILIFFIGLKDDILPVSAFKKFLVQLVAAGIVIFIADIRLKSLYGFLGLDVLDYSASYALSFIIIIGITNAINLIDGMNGLAGSIVFIICATFAFLFYQNDLSSYYIVCTCLCGAMLGFLRYNLVDAKIFMGDTGSLICGFIISVLALKYVDLSTSVDGAKAGQVIAILFVPIVDTVRVFFIRILNGTSPFAPDRNHFHHRLLALGVSPILVVAILCVLNLSVILTTQSFTYLGNNIIIGILVGIGLLFSILVEILTPKAS